MIDSPHHTSAILPWTDTIRRHDLVYALIHDREISNKLYFDNVLIFNELVGQQNLCSYDLLFYPHLNRYLRDDAHYPRFIKEIKLAKKEAKNVKKQRDFTVDESLSLIRKIKECYDIYCSEKNLIDKDINNALYLFSDKEIPRLQSHKAHYKPLYDGRHMEYLELKFNDMHFYSRKHHSQTFTMNEKAQLYILDPCLFFKETNMANYLHIFNGGFLNTPVLQFYVNRNPSKNKGHKVWLDLYTQEMTRSKEKALSFAKQYDNAPKWVEFMKE